MTAYIIQKRGANVLNELLPFILNFFSLPHDKKAGENGRTEQILL
jgi:hypothetical protein